MEQGLRHVLRRLDARFDAELASSEETAAIDLARAMEQGLGMREVLAASKGSVGVLNAGVAPEQVTVVGTDYVGTGWPLRSIRPLMSARLVISDTGRPPAVYEDAFHEVARRWARRREKVHVLLEDASQRGSLRQVGPDCVVLEAAGARTLVPLSRVRAIRLVRED